TGQALGTSAPSLVIGSAVGMLTKNPKWGLYAGAFTPSYIQNYGDVWGSVRDDKGIQEAIKRGDFTEREAAMMAAAVAVPIAALDAWGLEKTIGAGAYQEVKQNIIKRAVKAMAKG